MKFILKLLKLVLKFLAPFIRLDAKNGYFNGFFEDLSKKIEGMENDDSTNDAPAGDDDTTV